MCRGASDLFDDDTVITGAVQPQVLQDGSHLQQSQSVTGEQHRGRGLILNNHLYNDTRQDGEQTSPHLFCRHKLLPLYLRQELGLKDASGLQRFRNLSSEQETFLGHVYEDVPHNFTKVHAAAHFLISVKHSKRHTWISGAGRCLYGGR